MPSDSLTRLRGQIESVTYADEESGFVVARVRVPGRRKPVTVIGTMASPAPGETIEMEGEWGNHRKYGEQFRIVSCRCTAPATVQGIEKYLGSGLIRGIGPVMARRIVEMFGKETLDIIEKEPDRLAAVEGIGGKRIEQIRKAWAEQKEIREVMIFLQSHGVSAAFGAKIYRQYGNDSIPIVRENPYRLAADIFGIGFLTADRIAEKMGFARDSALRVEAGILHVLHELADEGHVYCPRGRLIETCGRILQVDGEVVVRALGAAAAGGTVVIEDPGGDAAGVEAEDRAVYLAGYHAAETGVAARLRELLRVPRTLRKIDGERAVPWIQEKLSITLAEKQIEAVRTAAESKVMILTGGPGTGKTTILLAVLKMFSAAGAGILLAAPTGRAAKRMGEATGREAKTIHRLLEYNVRKGGFQKNEDSPLDCDLLIVDEASMIDTLLMHHLLKALPRKSSLLLVGDVNQLPSVGAGNVLRDIIDSRVAPVVRLEEIFRQARESAIVVNAHRINGGLLPDPGPPGDRIGDFYFIEQGDPEKALELIISLVRDRIPKRFGFDPMNDIQVLTPMHKGTVGAASLNAALQDALNPGGAEILRGGRRFRVNDRVMQTVNNYEREVYNGDIGRIASVDEEAGEVAVTFDDREIRYDISELDELILAYAVSVHKSQGSEYPAVVLPVLTQHYVLLQRNLLYTGVTRGKRLVVIVGTRRAMAIAVRNDKTMKRFTLLRQRLEAPGPSSPGAGPNRPAS
jgi:exodeoxyribonuclease V alpha subunit